MDSILHFLTQLQKNNNKTWFDAHKKEFEQAKKEFLVFVASLLENVSSFDKDIKDIQAKDCVFRIYRDVRFAKDKTPYKNHFGAFICANGKKSNGPGYYVHLQPSNQSFIGGGIYMPEGEMLAKIRQEIDYNGQKLIDILKKPSFKKHFPKLWDEDKLSRPPKGYEADNPFIEILKLKSFIVSQPLSDEQIKKGKLIDICSASFKEQHALNDFLQEALN